MHGCHWVPFIHILKYIRNESDVTYTSHVWYCMSKALHLWLIKARHLVSYSCVICNHFPTVSTLDCSKFWRTKLAAPLFPHKRQHLLNSIPWLTENSSVDDIFNTEFMSTVTNIMTNLMTNIMAGNTIFILMQCSCITECW